MTTIAASLDTMASDSRVSVGGGTSYPAEKIRRVRKMLVGACGHGGDCSRFLEWAARDFKEPQPKWHCRPNDDEAIFCLVLKSDGLYAFTQTDPEPEKINAGFFAIGSGGKAARVALILGKSPEEAVTLACEVDGFSGLPVQVLKLKE
jgi:ATP-dependent protease HslVU (ClpYQ) peptidase subunit